MANEQNLKPCQSKSEARERGHLGGIASGEARRKKKTMREAVETMLTLELTDKEVKALSDKGYDAQTQLDALAAAALIGAKRGNSQMFANLMRLMGEGSEKIELSVNDESVERMKQFYNDARTDINNDT